MSSIKRRKHLNPFSNVALAAILMPIAAQAADTTATPARTMQEIQVSGNAENEFKAEKASSAKYTEALVDTAQTISVIKRELIQQQGAVSLTEALRNTPGVGAFFLGENGSTSTGDAIYMRGFDSSTAIFVDGVRDVGSISRDVFNIEQIDVLKGPAGTDTGRASPTGSVNLVSKQANLENAISGSVLAGSAKQKRGTLDVNHVIDAERGVAIRLNALAQDSGNPARDLVKNKRWAIAPSLAIGLNSDTRAYVNFLHVDQDNVPDGGVPTIGLPGYTSPDLKRPFISNAAPVDPSGFYGSATDYDKVKADMFTLKLEHDFSRTLKLQNISRWGKTHQDYLLSSFTASSANLLTPDAANPSTWTLARTNRTVKDQTNKIATNQTNVTWDVDTGALHHTLVGGLELTREKQDTIGKAGLGTLRADPIYAPNPNSPVTNLNPVESGAYTDSRVDIQSVYLFDSIKWGEQWIFTAGARADHFKVDYQSAALSTATSNPTLPVGTLLPPVALALSDTVSNGKLSVLYKPTPTSSVYALVATSKMPPGTNFALSANANSASNPRYVPQSSTTGELGAKWDLLQQKLSLTAAVYRTTVKNELEQDPVDLQYYQTGKKRVQGVELGLTGALTRDWLISAGYAHMDTEVTQGALVTAAGVNALSYTPKNSFTAWTSYNVNSALKIGGGARYVGELLRGTDNAIGTPRSADAYWVVDAMASYAVNKNLDLQLNVYNLADKAYIASINKSGYRYTPGAPRSASVTANFRF